jgi:hypothetical protein
MNTTILLVHINTLNTICQAIIITLVDIILRLIRECSDTGIQ